MLIRKNIDQHSSYLSVRRSRDDNTVNELSLQQENQLVKITPNPREVHLIPSSHRTQIFKDISSLNLSNLNNNNESSNTYIIQITSNHKEGHKTLRIQNTVDNNTEETFNLESESTNQHIVILNIKKDNKQQIFLDSTQNNTQFTVSTLSKRTYSFSTVLLQDSNLRTTRGIPVRIDGWSADKLPFFDASNGLSVGQSGMYIVPSNGFYYVTVSLIVKNPSQRYYYNLIDYNLIVYFYLSLSDSRRCDFLHLLIDNCLKAICYFNKKSI